MYPLNQIPPQKKQLPGFVWFDEIRPKDRWDIFVWRGKQSGTELKPQPRRQAPLQSLEAVDSGQGNVDSGQENGSTVAEEGETEPPVTPEPEKNAAEVESEAEHE